MKKKIIIVIPAFNEEEILEKNILDLYFFLQKKMKRYNWKVIISDNASSDKTLKIAKNLAHHYPKIGVVHREERPMSSAIKKSWEEYEADIYSYMDADLSADIHQFPLLIKAIEEGYDISIGSRTSRKSKTSRSFKRNILSLGLIFITKRLFNSTIEDFQCGFKAINRKTRDEIIPKMKHTKVGFMSTELILVASKKGYKIKEIPINWKDTRKSKNSILRGIIDALINLFIIKKDLRLGRYN